MWNRVGKLFSRLSKISMYFIELPKYAQLQRILLDNLYSIQTLDNIKHQFKLY